MSQLYNFNYALTLTNQMFGLDVDQEDFEEIALVGWDLIGNKNTQNYRYNTEVSNLSGIIDIPCNASEIEAVTKQSVSDSSEKISGDFIDFKVTDSEILIDNYCGPVSVYYKGIIADDDGLPYLSNKEALALATYVAYTMKFKDAIVNNNQNSLAISQELQRQWYIRCDQARAPQSLSYNTMDKILDVNTRWDRKVYGKPYKVK